MDIPIKGINHITFSVSDLNVSIAFYQQVLGAKLLLRGERMAYFDLAGTWLALNVQDDIPRHEIWQSYTHLALTIDESEMERMEQHLLQWNVPMRLGRPKESGEGSSLYFTDPDGHLLEFHTGDLQTRLCAYRESTPDLTFYD